MNANISLLPYIRGSREFVTDCVSHEAIIHSDHGCYYLIIMNINGQGNLKSV
jgi:hypothetical protein